MSVCYQTDHTRNRIIDTNIHVTPLSTRYQIDTLFAD